MCRKNHFRTSPSSFIAKKRLLETNLRISRKLNFFRKLSIDFNQKSITWKLLSLSFCSEKNLIKYKIWKHLKIKWLTPYQKKIENKKLCQCKWMYQHFRIWYKSVVTPTYSSCEPVILSANITTVQTVLMPSHPY